VCLEVDRDHITVLVQRKPDAGMDMLTVLGRQLHAAQELVRSRAMRNPNEVIEKEATFPERLADSVARFWRLLVLHHYVWGRFSRLYGRQYTVGPVGLGSYPFILLNLFLSMLAAIQAPVIMMSQNRQGRQGSSAG